MRRLLWNKYTVVGEKKEKAADACERIGRQIEPVYVHPVANMHAVLNVYIMVKINFVR